ncbi:hypothetical protein Golax_017249, partial [Gossypium laxum]|nr:hypothetical protein [Gossypium laxum]
WIRFPSLPGYLYSHKILTEIGELVGKVVKLDMNTDSRARGYFVRMAVYVNLEKPLVSQILINGQSQKDLLDQLGQELVAQQSSVVVGSSSQTLAVMGVTKTKWRWKVGSLDSGKHSAVVFLESKNTSNKNSAHSLKNNLASNQESMEQLTESISAFSKAKIVSGVLTRTDEQLKSATPIQPIPWLIMGDFNVILSLADKKSPFTVSKHCDLFGNFVDSCKLQDLGYSGPSYTWQRGGGGIFEKLYGEAPLVLKNIPNFGFPYLTPLEITFLEATIKNEEIKRVLFNMAPLKAPKNDGYHVHFFQSQ